MLKFHLLTNSVSFCVNFFEFIPKIENIPIIIIPIVNMHFFITIFIFHIVALQPVSLNSFLFDTHQQLLFYQPFLHINQISHMVHFQFLELNNLYHSHF